MLKKRKAKRSERGIYLQDKVLAETAFQPGSHFSYQIQKGKLIIQSSGAGNTVSKRLMKNNKTKPVIDIRHKEALSAFEGCDILQVEIDHDQIIVSGYEEPKKRSGMNENKRTVVHMDELAGLKRKAQVAFTRSQLQMAVGDSVPADQIEWITRKAQRDIDAACSVNSIVLDLDIPIKVASLFSGAGLMDAGFIQAGFSIQFAVELNQDAAQTYHRNIGPHMVHADIQTIDKRDIPPVDLIIGGSPCQGFSNSNRYTNFLDNPNNMLVNEYIASVQSNPTAKVFVLENVPQILTAGDGQFYSEIKEKLSAFGFKIKAKVLDALDYGVAQTRKRAIIIGSKIGDIDFPEPLKQPVKTVRDALKGLQDTLFNQQDVSVPKEETLERMSHVPPGGNVHYIPEEIRPKGQHSSMYKRLEWDKPAGAIVNFRKSMIMPPHEDRILTVREAARLFGMEDDRHFYGTLSSRQQMVANGVPQPMAKAIADEVKEAFQRYFVRIMSTKEKTIPAF